MLTLFSIPKPFRGHIAVIQRNAIQSWTLLRPACEIILFGDDEGTAEIAKEFGVRHIPEIARNEFGTPLLDSLFAKAQLMATNDLLCYVNADIILMSDFLPAIQRVRKKRRFLLVGQRWDINLDKPWDFDNPEWEVRLRAYMTKAGKLHPSSGIDYFVFPRGLYHDLPSFAIGRLAWDNWLIYRGRSLGVPVIDTTDSVMVVHQNHDYAHCVAGKIGVRKGPEVKRNLEIAGGHRHNFSLRAATHVLTPKKLKLNLSRRQLAWNISWHLNTLSILFPYLRPVVMLIMTLTRISKPLRSALELVVDSTRREKR